MRKINLRKRIIASAIAVCMMLPFGTNAYLNVQAAEATEVVETSEAGTLEGVENNEPTENESTATASDATEIETTKSVAEELECNYETAEELVANLAMYAEPDIGETEQQANFNQGITGVHGSMPSKGNVHVLVIPVEFSDYKFEENIEEKLDSAFFGEENEEDYIYPYESVSAYYERASFRQLHLSGEVIPKISLAYERNIYETDRELFSDVADAYKAYLLQDYTGDTPKEYIQECLAKYDSNQDGEVDGVYIYYAGGVISKGSIWWSHVYSNGLIEDKDKDLSINSSVCMLGHDYSDHAVACHETGHMLGLGDYYLDQEGLEGGIYSTAMMGFNYGDFTIFSKLLLGWIDPSQVKIIHGDLESVELEESVIAGQCAIVIPDYNSQQGIYTKFFLIDYQTYKDNSSCPFIDADYSKGLRVYYVDATLDEARTSFLHYNNREECSLCPLIRQIHADATATHITCSYSLPPITILKQFSYDNFEVSKLDCNFKDGDELTPYTMPSSKFVAKGADVFSGVTITDICLENEKAYFKAGVSGEKKQVPVEWSVIDNNKDTTESLNILNVELQFNTDINLSKCDRPVYLGYAEVYENAYVEDEAGEKVMGVNTLIRKYVSGQVKFQGDTGSYLKENTQYTLVIPKGTLYDSCGNEIEEIRIPYSTNIKYKLETILDIPNVHYGYQSDILVDENGNGIYVDGDYEHELISDYEMNLYQIENGEISNAIPLDIPYINNIGALWKVSDSMWGIIDTSDIKNIVVYMINNIGTVLEKKEIENKNICVDSGRMSIDMAYYASGTDVWLFSKEKQEHISLSFDDTIGGLLYFDENIVIVNTSVNAKEFYVFDHMGKLLHIVKNGDIFYDLVKEDNRYLFLGEETIQIFDNNFTIIKDIPIQKEKNLGGTIYKISQGYVFFGGENKSIIFFDKHFNEIQEIKRVGWYDSVYNDNNNTLYMVSSDKQRLLKLDYSAIEFSNSTEHDGYTYDVVHKEASCSEQGLKDVVEACSLCGEEISRKENVVIAKKAHTAGEWIVDKEATEEEEGNRHKECTVCGYTMETESIPKLVPETNVESIEISAGETDISKVLEGSEVALTATITPENASDKTVTWISGDETIATVDETGNVTAVSEGTVMITATANDGSGKSGEITITVVKPHEHAYATEWTYDADKHWHACTEQGCDGSKSDLGTHTAGEWIVDKEATEEEEGSRHKECTICGYTMETESIPKLVPAVAKPKAVANLRAASFGYSRVRLTWTKTDDADGYLIYAQKNGKYGYCGMTASNAFTDVKALDSDYNFYWVFPYKELEDGRKLPGGCTKYVYAKGITPKVQNFKASSVTGGVKLTWTKSTGAEGYLIYGMTASGKYHYIGMTTATSYVDKKASKTEYNFYWIFPYNKKDGRFITGPICDKYVYGKAK